MITQYASKRTKAETELRRATEELTQSRAYLAIANADDARAQAAREKWIDTYPGRAEREPDRPYFQGPRGAVLLDGTEVTYESAGQIIPAAPDITAGPPPTSNAYTALQDAVTKAEAKVEKLTKARANVKPEDLKTTGYEAGRNFKAAGIVYSIGDPFDPKSVDPRKLNQLLDHRFVVRVGHGS